MFSKSFTDEETCTAIKNIYEKYKYIIDPHGAVGYLSLQKYLEINNLSNYNGIVIETAHPAKFKEVVENTTGLNLELPERLATFAKKENHSTKISNKYSELKDFLISR